MIKRFIAGAVCPSCAALDRLVIFNDSGLMVCECVVCGFTDAKTQELKAKDSHQGHDPAHSPVPDAELIPVKNLD